MRPIDADALIRRVIARYKKMMGTDIGHGMGAIASMITAAPTLDLEPVRHGRWQIEWRIVAEDMFTGEAYEHPVAICPFCGDEHYGYTNNDTDSWGTAFNFCPNCGVKMDKEEGI